MYLLLSHVFPRLWRLRGTTLAVPLSRYARRCSACCLSGTKTGTGKKTEEPRRQLCRNFMSLLNFDKIKRLYAPVPVYMALRYEVILMPKAPVPMTMKDAEDRKLAGVIPVRLYCKGKHLYISVDGKTIPQSPLCAWKSKPSRTMICCCIFFLTDLLTENEQE